MGARRPLLGPTNMAEHPNTTSVALEKPARGIVRRPITTIYFPEARTLNEPYGLEELKQILFQDA